MTQLESTRRSGLRFVKAAKTDEEWSAQFRAGFATQREHHLTSKETAEDNARWYRELVGGNGNSKSSIHDTTGLLREARVLSNSPIASTSKATLDGRSASVTCNPEAVAYGIGTLDEPCTLSDEGEPRLNIHNDDSPAEDAIIGDNDNGDTKAKDEYEENPDNSSGQLEPLPNPLHQEASSSIESTGPQDMYCLLCETIVPAADVAGHRTSILHQLSKNGSNSKDRDKPLVPPTHYGVRSSNIGYGMLQRLGWVEDTGLGSGQLGRKTPLKASEKFDRKGLGVDGKRRAGHDDDNQSNASEGHNSSTKRPKTSSSTDKSQTVAKPLAKNRKELEKHKRREMQMFKEGLAYLNT